MKDTTSTDILKSERPVVTEQTTDHRVVVTRLWGDDNVSEHEPTSIVSGNDMDDHGTMCQPESSTIEGETASATTTTNR